MSLVKHSARTVRKPCRSCGSSELYWAHDTDRAYHKHCDRCNVTGGFVLIEKDGSRHDCRITSGEPEDSMPDMDPDGPTEDDEKEVSPVAAPVSPDVQQALGMLVGALTPQVDRAEIEAMVKEAVANVVFPTRTVVERANGARIELSGATHHKLGDVITSLMAGEHVLMVGPAGTGKSTIAEQAAEALGLKSYSISLSPQTPASQVLGYMQATGDYVPSLFREAYEHGGVFHFDEMDNAHPSVLAVVNAALANGHMAFPDQMVKRHPDFRAVASANTYGRGATRSYVGRQAIDAATLDRFSVETIEVDETLENELCHSTGLETDLVERVLFFVRRLRANAEAHSMPVVISPRASVGMCRLLRAGRSWESAVEARVRRGMGDTEWNKLSG
ncbi:AAA family ATPase [Kibdelosporangium lantanae]|uniref:AAA family ATPase n=1 Tax=Kibdelosporangium lantanae TaxID=1497396 RepID=A0ABW3M0S3_9PSEU